MRGNLIYFPERERSKVSPQYKALLVLLNFWHLQTRTGGCNPNFASSHRGSGEGVHPTLPLSAPKVLHHDLGGSVYDALSWLLGHLTISSHEEHEMCMRLPPSAPNIAAMLQAKGNSIALASCDPLSRSKGSNKSLRLLMSATKPTSIEPRLARCRAVALIYPLPPGPRQNANSSANQ